MSLSQVLIIPLSSYDRDAKNYISRVEAADSDYLEQPVKRAINKLIRRLKSTPSPIAATQWDAICAGTALLMCGAKTLTGALVPLHKDMPTPTNYNFVSGDYNRRAGLKGDGTTKFLGLGINNDSVPQDDRHLAAWQTEHCSRDADRALVGCGLAVTSNANSQLLFRPDDRRPRLSVLTAGDVIVSDATSTLGMYCASRSTATNIMERYGGVSEQRSSTSSTPAIAEILAFSRGTSAASPAQLADSRMPWVSFGRAVDPADLDFAIGEYLTTLAAVLP